MTLSSQASLFDEGLLPGLRYQPELVTVAEEAALIDDVARLDLKPFEFQGWQGKRRVIYYGWRYDFNDSRLTPAPELPDFLQALRARAALVADVAPAAFAHALVAEYAPGAGIGWHRDRPVFDVVAGVSLASDCVLRLRRRTGAGFERAALPLARRSVYVLSGPARHEWEHSIAPMKALRYSITFRSMRAR